MKIKGRVASITAVIAALLLTGCGSSGKSSSASSTTSLTPSQAQNVSTAVSTAVSEALAGAVAQAALEHGVPTSALSNPSMPVPAANLAYTVSCNTSSSGTNCTFSDQWNCPNGGSVASSGSFSDTVDSSVTGSLNYNVVVTPTSCNIDGFVLNGAPSITAAEDISFSNGALVYPFTFTEDGGVSFGPDPSGTCNVNLKYTANSATSYSLTGSVCGTTVSYSS